MNKVKVMTNQNKQLPAPKTKKISERRVIQKISSALHSIGSEAVNQALTLFYTLRAPATPLWCRTVILGSLAYFISMIDGIPDLTPFLGYTDDISVMAAAIATVSQYITPEIKQKAQEKTVSIMGQKKDKKE
ncbi:MAG: uncharacterized membrane protein YkvA (DUF1232 family) [Oleiphilaceae bacterium]|jgi:uncharacterized membrane protein YkvA (DUF1232 family)